AGRRLIVNDRRGSEQGLDRSVMVLELAPVTLPVDRMPRILDLLTGRRLDPATDGMEYLPADTFTKNPDDYLAAWRELRATAPADAAPRGAPLPPSPASGVAVVRLSSEEREYQSLKARLGANNSDTLAAQRRLGLYQRRLRRRDDELATFEDLLSRRQAAQS